MEQSHVKVTILGKEELSKKLNAAIHQLGSLEPVFVDIGARLKEFYSTVPFLTSGAIYGKPWQPLDPRYKKYKERKFPGRGILVKSGTLRDSFTFTPTPISVTIENTVDYFAKHQQGLGVPQRVSMTLDRERELNVRGWAGDMLDRMIRRAWN